MQKAETFWKQRKPEFVSFVGGHYKWFVLIGTLMISVSPAVREQPREEERRFSEAYENANRYTSLKDDLTALRGDIRGLKAKLNPNLAPAQSTQTPLSNDGFIDAIVVLTRGAEETLQDNEPFIALAGTKERSQLTKQNDDLRKQLNEISHDLKNATLIAAEDKSEVMLFQQMKSLYPLFARAEGTLDQSGKLRAKILVPLILYRERLELRSQLLGLLSYVMLTLGILTVVSAQWIARPGEAPELRLD